ncbi:MAG: hypothetical protein C0601_06460 [Candidatus Muiribacterium halophilum]|uniref:Cation:proton antiporter n=1 Tax=Muiribacterium halophilum TaxID=2053465 RepID=A0A2N5ZG38_MUIH1|nr:MAG: hypothetical protein C0601_06460 [Candidatus Muirbacterium halophilum]
MKLFIYFDIILIMFTLMTMLYRKGLFDRIILLNIISLIIIILMCILSISLNIWYYLDIALVYAVLSFSGIVALCNYFSVKGEG